MANVLFGHGYWGKIVEKAYTLDSPLLIHDPEKKKTLNLKSLLKKPEFRGYLAVPPSEHKQLLWEILRENPEAKVLVEKPVMLNDSAFTWGLAADWKDNVIAGHTFLHEEGFKSLVKSLPKDGREIYITGERFNRAGPCRTNMNNLQDYGIHDIYLFYEVCRALYGELYNYSVVEARTIHSTKLSSLFELSYRGVHARFETRAVSPEKVRMWRVNAEDYTHLWDYNVSKNVGKTPLQIQWDILGSKNTDHTYHTIEDAYRCQKIIEKL
jgi:hypothetical protein